MCVCGGVDVCLGGEGLRSLNWSVCVCVASELSESGPRLE